MSLCDVFLLSLTPVRTLMVKGIDPRVRFMPMRILPSFPGVSSTIPYRVECQPSQNRKEREQETYIPTQHQSEIPYQLDSHNSRPRNQFHWRPPHVARTPCLGS